MVSYANAVLYGTSGLVVATQEKFVYVPVLPCLPKSYLLTPHHEDLWLRSSDGVRLHSWFYQVPPRLLSYGASDGYPSHNGITRDAQIKQPILFLSGLQDEIVPPVHMQKLYAKAAAHNTWAARGDDYWTTIEQLRILKLNHHQKMAHTKEILSKQSRLKNMKDSLTRFGEINSIGLV